MISMNDVILILSHKMDKWNFDYGREEDSWQHTRNVQQFGNVWLIEIPFYLNSLSNFDNHRLFTEY